MVVRSAAAKSIGYRFISGRGCLRNPMQKCVSWVSVIFIAQQTELAFTLQNSFYSILGFVICSSARLYVKLTEGLLGHDPGILIASQVS